MSTVKSSNGLSFKRQDHIPNFQTNKGAFGQAVCGREGPTWEYQMMPSMATLMPASFLRGISSPKNMQPPIRMMTVLMWPTTLYVSDDVAPITKKVDRLTCSRVPTMLLSTRTQSAAYTAQTALA
jgi:hypothetical protein